MLIFQVGQDILADDEPQRWIPGVDSITTQSTGTVSHDTSLRGAFWSAQPEWKRRTASHRNVQFWPLLRFEFFRYDYTKFLPPHSFLDWLSMEEFILFLESVLSKHRRETWIDDLNEVRIKTTDFLAGLRIFKPLTRNVEAAELTVPIINTTSVTHSGRFENRGIIFS